MYDILITQFDTEITYFAICLITFFASFYLFCKACVIKPNKNQWLYLICVGIGLSMLFMVLKQFGDQLPHLVMYFSIPFLISVLGKRNFITNISAAFVATALYKVAKIVSSVLDTTILYAIGLNRKIIFANIGNLIVAFVLCVLFMKVKRFKKR